MQTKEVLRRPFCLVELLTAIIEGIPVRSPPPRLSPGFSSQSLKTHYGLA